MKRKEGVIWVSTVLYIMISLAIISIVLVAVKPRIDSAQDKATIEQTIILLNEIDSTITRADITQGTVLKQEFKMSRGLLTIDSKEDLIEWQFSSSYQYSETGMPIKIGKIKVLTQKAAPWNVTLTLNYANMNLTYLGEDENYILQPAEIPYKLFMENKGPTVAEDKNQIDIYGI